MINTEYANAYTEVLEILKYIPREDYNKIPKEKIQLFTTNANKDYHFEYNPQIDLSEQNTSKIAKTIIAILFRDYWATKEQREKILVKEKFDMQKQEQELKEKYSNDNLFKTREIKKIEIVNPNNATDQIAMTEYKKETFWSKVYNKIKSIFRK